MKRLTSTMKTVLTNLDSGRPMWTGVHCVNPGGGIPSVTQALRKRGYIALNDRGVYVITVSGRSVVSCK